MTGHLDNRQAPGPTRPVPITTAAERLKGELPIEAPRDRQGQLAPQLIPKHRTRWAGFDNKIQSMSCA